MSLLAPDDIKVNDFIAIHSHQEHDHLMPVFGHAFKVKAVQRPFFVVEHFATKDRVTFDERMFKFMKVDEDFAKAQVEPPKPQQQQVEVHGIPLPASVGQMLMQRLMRQQQPPQEEE